MDGSTWLEGWQGVSGEECGTPVAPHVGGSFNYTYNDGVLTVFGAGAHLGLAKVTNQGEDGVADGDSIVYLVSFSGDDNDVMTVDVQYPNGYWRYVYSRPVPPPPPPATVNVTFELNTESIAETLVDNISGSDLFVAGPNATWTDVFVSTTAADGAASQGTQTLTINVTSLPDGGVNYRVYKTTANGSDFFGNAQALSLGLNTITVAGVGFDRAVKFQFSSGDVEFNHVSNNGNALHPEIYAGGGILQSHNAVLLTDFDLDGTFIGVATINANTPGNYIFLNGNCGDYSCKENLEGLACADEGNWNDRILPGISADTTIKACFGSCESDGSCPAPPPPTPMLSLQGVLDLYWSVPDGDPEGIGYSGTDGKALHLKAIGDISDLSLYGLGIANNGGGTDGVEYTFPQISVSSGEDILVYRVCLLYTSPSPRDVEESRMPSSA